MTAQKPQKHIQGLITAGEYFTSGRFNEAIAACNGVLTHEPGNADALHILGLSHLNTNQAIIAVENLAKATAARKSDGGIANSLALAHLALDQIDEAAAALEKLARKGKLPAEGLTTLGDCRLRQGDPKKARACFEQALKLKPDLQAALVNLGEALKESELLDEAISHYENITSRFPELTSAWRNLGLVLQDAERFAESVTALEKYLADRPHDLVGLKALGFSYFLCSDFEKSLNAFDTAFKLNNDDAEIWNNRGLLYRAMNRIDEARDAFDKALSIDPDFNTARLNLAHLQHDILGVDAALELMNEAVEREPDNAKIHLKRSEAYLLEGQIAEAWDDYRWRYKKPPYFSGLREHPFPPWAGEDLSSQTILLWAEQGIGDEILYSGLIPEFLSRAEHVVIEVEYRLVPLAERSFPSARVVARTFPADRQFKTMGIDYQISMCELMPLVRPTRDKFPLPQAYLKCDEEKRNALRKKYKKGVQNSPLVGIAWHSAIKKIGWLKSIPLDGFKPILSRPHTTFVSLQYGDHRQDINNMNLTLEHSIIEDESIDSMKDLDTYAAQVAAMDIVITNSNTAAHVAGALGIPTWVIVPRLGTGILQWYWFRSGSKSSWYENMRIYRQTDWHNWTEVIDRVASDLGEFLDR
jgi:tetratricopeptide (TPR) repeat protein